LERPGTFADRPQSSPHQSQLFCVGSAPPKGNHEVRGARGTLHCAEWSFFSEIPSSSARVSIFLLGEQKFGLISVRSSPRCDSFLATAICRSQNAVSCREFRSVTSRTQSFRRTEEKSGSYPIVRPREPVIFRRRRSAEPKRRSPLRHSARSEPEIDFRSPEKNFWFLFDSPCAPLC
jgi:hypothetical protein